MDNSVLEKYKIDFNDEIKREIIEAAVDVYGESCRAMIEDRIDKIRLIQYITPDDIRKVVTHSFCNKSDDLTVKFLEEMGFEVPEGQVRNIDEDMKKVLNIYFGHSSFSDSMYTNIFYFEKHEKSEWEIKQCCEFLEKMGGKYVASGDYDSFIESPEGKETLDEIERVLGIIKGLIKEYDEFKQEFSGETKYLEECEQLERKLSNEGMKEFYGEIKDLLTEEEQREAELMFSKESNWTYSFSGMKCEKFFPFKIYNMSPIEAFDDECDDYRKKSEMVTYFRACGLNLGYDYSAYEKSDEAKKLVPSQNVVKRIKEAREGISKKVLTQYFIKTGTISDNIKEIESLNLLDETSFSQEFVDDGVICINPNAVKTSDNTIDNVNLLYFPPLKTFDEYKDVSFIHEILHALEGSMEKDGDEYIFSTGFEKIRINVENDSVLDINKECDKEIRKYELFSENIHQRLAMEVTSNLHSKGISIAKNVEQKVKGGTSYENFDVVTKDFYDRFKKQIMYARMTGRTDRLITYTGKDNFELLNDLVGSYRELPYYSMMSDIINKRETPLTQKRMEIISKAQTIVMDMEKADRDSRSF